MDFIKFYDIELRPTLRFVKPFRRLHRPELGGVSDQGEAEGLPVLRRRIPLRGFLRCLPNTIENVAREHGHFIDHKLIHAVADQPVEGLGESP